MVQLYCIYVMIKCKQFLDNPQQVYKNMMLQTLRQYSILVVGFLVPSRRDFHFRARHFPHSLTIGFRQMMDTGGRQKTYQHHDETNGGKPCGSLD